MTVEAVSSEDFSPFEEINEKTTPIWNGRKVEILPANKSYKAMGPWDSPWKYKRDYNPNWPSKHPCNLCNHELIDFFFDYWIVTVNQQPISINGSIFYRTCQFCYNKSNCEKIFKDKCFTEMTDKGKVAFKKYVLPSQTYDIQNATVVRKSYYDKLQTFLDNFDSCQANINESLLAGFFKSFGLVRDSVDFFLAVGDHLRSKIGLDREKEKKLLSKNSGLSPETIEALKDVPRYSPLEMFQEVFPTGEQSQRFCCSLLGIKFQPNAPYKRVLEQVGSSAIFGPLWTAITTAGQVAVESGFIKNHHKPFYEIGLALLSHKAIKIGKNAPVLSEMESLTKSLESTVDLKKISSGNINEINRASKAVDEFLESRKINPPKIEPLVADSSKLLPTQANNVCGWKVGDAINNRTLLGDVPSWSTVRARHWKNKALDHKLGKVTGEFEYKLTPENINRMEKGLAPQYYNRDLKKWESVELHHEPPQREGGLFDFEELTVDQHKGKDAFRAGLNRQKDGKNDN